MQTLAFHKLNQIKSALKHIPQKDLVLVFSQAAGDRLLLIYNAADPPAVPDPEWQTHSLKDLQPSNYADFDGLVCGISALDVILPGIPTHGLNFCSFRHLFTSPAAQASLKQNKFRLARFLLNYLEALPPEERTQLWYRGAAKIFELSLPVLLEGSPLENLVAILPAQDLQEYLEEKAFQLIYVRELGEGVRFAEGQWVLALEEINLLYPGIFAEDERFLALRPILRDLGEGAAIAETCRTLARQLVAYAEQVDDDGFRPAAYSLAAEAWLWDEDVEDLVVLIPHQDLMHFVETGDALRVYRVPQMGEFQPRNIVGQSHSLGELVEHKIGLGQYTAHPLSFPILSPALKELTTCSLVDLGLVLWRAGKENELARTFWLLSRDLLYLPDPAWEMIRSRAEDRSDLARRAALLFSLSDPWTWRQGRYPMALAQVYMHLCQCLDAQARSETPPLSSFAEMLRSWYGSHAAKDLVASLSEMVQFGWQGLEKLQGAEGKENEHETVVQLITIGEALLRKEHRFKFLAYPHEERFSVPFGVSRFKRRIADSKEDIPLLSPPFEGSLRNYQRLHNRWQEVQDMIGGAQPWREKADRLMADYQTFKRSAYGPAHELEILYWRCREDLRQLRQFKMADDFGPIIRLYLRNPWIKRGQREELHIDAENLGQENAYDFQVVLAQSGQFEMVSSPLSRPVTLAPRSEQRFIWQIHTQEETLTLTFRYRYQDHKGVAAANEEEIHVPVQMPRKRNSRPVGGNIYQFGPPVFGEDRFFGRRKELTEIISRLMVSDNRTPVLLRGPRRLGKTSIMRQLEWLLSEPRALRALGFTAEEAIQISNVHLVSTSLQEIDPSAPRYPARFFQTIFTDICEVLSVTVPESDLTRLFDISPTRAFTKQLDHVFAQRPQAKPLVLLDEWDEIYRPELLALQNLRAVIQDETRVKWLISSTWTLSAESGRYGSPFYNSCSAIELHELGWNPARDLVIRQGEKIGVLWQGEAVVAVLEQTGRRPYLTQLVCAKVVDHLYEASKSEVDRSIVEIVISQIIQEAHTSAQYFGFLWGDETKGGPDQVNWLGRMILWVLDRYYPDSLSRARILREISEAFQHREFGPPPQEFFAEEFKAQMTLLHQIFDAIMLQEDRYRISIPLIRNWLHQIISRLEDPIGQMYGGLIQDWERARKQQSGH